MKINLERVAALSRIALEEEQMVAQVYDALEAMRPDAQVVLGWPDEAHHRVLFIYVEEGQAFMGSFSVPQGREKPALNVEDNALPFTSVKEFLRRFRDVRQGSGASRDEVFVDRNGAKVRLDEPIARDLFSKAGLPI